MNLPKEYLSWSQINLWQRNKGQYREQYYFDNKIYETPEMMYGREIANALERGDESLSHIPRYKKPEYKIKINIDGVPMLGYLDSYDPKKHAFYEYKTSHTGTWNPLSVRKHDQLTLYSLLIQERHRKVRNLCHLIELKTKWKKKMVEFNGMELEGDSRELELTGEFTLFPRKIEQWERDRMREIITKVAKEIEEDYVIYAKKD